MGNSGKFKKLHWQVYIASYLLNVNLYTCLLVENKFIQLLESLVASTLNMSSALSTRPFSQFWICIHLEILIFKPMKTISLKYHIWRYHVHDVKFQLLEQVHLEMKCHRRNTKRLVKVVLHHKSAYHTHWFFL